VPNLCVPNNSSVFAASALAPSVCEVYFLAWLGLESAERNRSFREGLLPYLLQLELELELQQ
jgi:hypothetical protein